MLRRYAPFLVVLVIAAVVAGFAISSSGGSSRKKVTVVQAGGGPEILSAGNKGSVDWGPRCDTKTGRVAIPTLYAPPCVAPFKGDNGGATAPGVSGDTVTVALYQAQPDVLQEAALQRSGSDESLAAETQTVQQYIKFFESHYETYGRHVKLVVVKASGSPDDAAAAKADAIRVATEVKAFASFGGPSQTEAYADELAARGVLCLGDCMLASSEKFVDARAPHIWLTLAAVDQAAQHWARFIGHQLAGHPARWAGDPLLRRQKRVFGLVRFDESFAGFNEAGRQFVASLKAGGIKLAADAPYQLDLSKAQENARDTIAKLKAAKVTTVIFGGDPLTPSYLTKEATAQHYFPEWVVLGAAYTDSSLFGRTYDQRQWAHAFGVSQLPTPVPQQLDDFSRLLVWDQGQPPLAKTYKVLVQAPLIFYTGVHLAGPRLTPQTFRDGLFRFPSSPRTLPVLLHMSWGNHGIWPKTDYFGSDDATAIWWDPTAQGPDEVGNQGTGLWQYADGGRRYLPSEWPSGEPHLFDPKTSVTRIDRLSPDERPPSYPSPASH